MTGLKSCFVQPGGDLRRVEAVYAGRYELHPRPTRTVLRQAGRDSLFEYWRGNMELQYGRFMYYFELEDNSGCIRYYGEGGFRDEPPQDRPWTWCFHYPCIWHHDCMDDPPDWAKDAVVYQIFVDRFANGDRKNDPPGVSEWGTPPTSQSLVPIANWRNGLKSIGNWFRWFGLPPEQPGCAKFGASSGWGFGA